GLLDALPANAVVVIASDHGNIEDVRMQHTRNPARGMVIGPTARGAALRTITDVAPYIRDLLRTDCRRSLTPRVWSGRHNRAVTPVPHRPGQTSPHTAGTRSPA